VSVVGLRPITLKKATLIVAEDDYTQAVGQVLFVPQVRWSWADRLGFDTGVPMYDGITWTCTVSYAQDWATPDSLAMYLIEHAAQTRTLVFRPDEESLAVRADVMIVPGQIGGVPNQTLSAAVTMPCFEEPTLGQWQEASG